MVLKYFTVRARFAALALPALVGGLGLVPISVSLAKPLPAKISKNSAVPGTLFTQAIEARAHFDKFVRNKRQLVIIDYGLPSSQERLFVIDLENGTTEAYLVAHGQGSDPDHNGIADYFSNDNGSHMSSLGAFVTGETYHGRHGMSLRLKGLEQSNDRAEERAIVIHGADYVSKDRDVIGRSWGCPALETDVALSLIPRIAGGTFIYAVR